MAKCSTIRGWLSYGIGNVVSHWSILSLQAASAEDPHTRRSRTECQLPEVEVAALYSPTSTPETPEWEGCPYFIRMLFQNRFLANHNYLKSVQVVDQFKLSTVVHRRSITCLLHKRVRLRSLFHLWTPDGLRMSQQNDPKNDAKCGWDSYSDKLELSSLNFKRKNSWEAIWFSSFYEYCKLQLSLLISAPSLSQFRLEALKGLQPVEVYIEGYQNVQGTQTHPMSHHLHCCQSCQECQTPPGGLNWTILPGVQSDRQFVSKQKSIEGIYDSMMNAYCSGTHPVHLSWNLLKSESSHLGSQTASDRDCPTWVQWWDAHLHPQRSQEGQWISVKIRGQFQTVGAAPQTMYDLCGSSSL